jgi:hypothetical protein
MCCEFGDFQTPVELAELVLRAIYRRGARWWRALEPTCGTGSFIRSLLSLENPPREICGIELQLDHVSTTRAGAGIGRTTQADQTVQVRIQHADIFQTNLAELPWVEQGPLLVVGNPPWVTNAQLGSLNSANLPAKSNLKRLRGLDAKTGESNFDIAEYIWIKLIKELACLRPTIALLCKTQVARNVLKFAGVNQLPISRGEIYVVDAKKWFGAAVDACLFRVDIGNGIPSYSADVYENLDAVEPQSVLNLSNGLLISDNRTYERLSFIDGLCAFEWRQGVKHDLAPVMELQESNGVLHNRDGEAVTTESEYVFPLLKSSDLHGSETPTPRYRVIITQRRLGDDTSELQNRAPRLWEYLKTHAVEFARRKSSIYTGRPPFSIFGIGDYAFSEYKVAVSGLYKHIHFRLVGPHSAKPVMLDDTCYFIPCDSLERACVLVELLNHPDCLQFLNAVVFKDSKRPVTKRVLQRIDIAALLSHVDKAALLRGVNASLRRMGSQVLSDPVEWERYVTP